jgi:hypothetical protein
MDESVPGFDYDDRLASSGPSLLDYLNFGGKTATGVLGALNQPKVAPGTAGKTNWAIIGGIAAAVLAVLVLVMVAGRGK